VTLRNHPTADLRLPKDSQLMEHVLGTSSHGWDRFWPDIPRKTHRRYGSVPNITTSEQQSNNGIRRWKL